MDLSKKAGESLDLIIESANRSTHHSQEIVKSTFELADRTTEVFKFFEETGGSEWEQQLESFIVQFSGCTFEVPGPNILHEIERDAVIVRSISAKDSAEHRINIMREHGVTHGHLEEIWRVCRKRNL